jgi:hypothetical protein
MIHTAAQTNVQKACGGRISSLIMSVGPPLGFPGLSP